MNRPRWVVLAAWLAHATAGAVEVAVGEGTRLEVSGFLDGVAVLSTEGGARQRPGLSTMLQLDARRGRALRGHVELRALAGGPYEGGHPGVFNFTHAFQNNSPAVEAVEAWAEVGTERARLRAGVQRFSWGALDGIPLVDVLNPRDFQDPLVTDVEEAKLGTPSVALTATVPDLARLSLRELTAAVVYVPWAVPSRLPLLEERWFPVAISVGDRVRLRRADLDVAVERLLSRQPDVPVDQVVVARDAVVPLRLATRNRRPPAQLDAGALGGRLGGRWGRHTVRLYYYTGPETGPNLDVRAFARTQVGVECPAGLGTFDPQRCAIAPTARALVALRQAHDVIQMVGIDWAAVLGDVALRFEAAWFQDRPTLRLGQGLLAAFRGSDLRLGPRIERCLGAGARRLLGGAADAIRCRGPIALGDVFVDRDTVEWGLGADTMIHGAFVLAQVSQIIGLDDAPRVIVADPETRLTTLLRRRFWQDALEIEARAVYAVERGGWFAFPRVSYAVSDRLRVRLGYLAVGGSRNSLFGQFGRNDEVVFQVRYGF